MPPTIIHTVLILISILLHKYTHNTATSPAENSTVLNLENIRKQCNDTDKVSFYPVALQSFSLRDRANVCANIFPYSEFSPQLSVYKQVKQKKNANIQIKAKEMLRTEHLNSESIKKPYSEGPTAKTEELKETFYEPD